MDSNINSSIVVLTLEIVLFQWVGGVLSGFFLHWLNQVTEHEVMILQLGMSENIW
jgi:hypothetical protein